MRVVVAGLGVQGQKRRRVAVIGIPVVPEAALEPSLAALEDRAVPSAGILVDQRIHAHHVGQRRDVLPNDHLAEDVAGGQEDRGQQHDQDAGGLGAVEAEAGDVGAGVGFLVAEGDEFHAVGDGLPERAEAEVVGIGHGEDGRGQLILQPLQR